MGFFNELFCKHEYKVIAEKQIPSKVDMTAQLGYTPNSWQSMTRKYVTVLNCTKCGKIHKIVDRTA